MIGVAVMGCGIVGSGVVKMLSENQKMICRAAGMPVRLSYVLDVRSVQVPAGAQYTARFEDLIEDDGVRILVETIGGIRPAYEFTKRALMSGRHVVTSNKALVAAHGDELAAIAREHCVKYLFEAAVGGGVPIIRPMMLCLAGNRIDRITGIINGSTNYLLTRMEETGKAFPEALLEAQKLGYVEGNPDADIEGWDARRKISILSAVAFGSKFSTDEQISCEGIARVTTEDIECARALNGRIKLIASAKCFGETWSAWVAPTLIPNNHVFFDVNGVYNAIQVHGDFVGDVVFQGQGAGSRPTASAVVGDIIDIASRADARSCAGAEPDCPELLDAGAQAARILIRVERTGQDEAQKIRAVAPEAEIIEVDERKLAVKLPRRPLNESMDVEKRLNALGLRVGVPIRLLDSEG